MSLTPEELADQAAAPQNSNERRFGVDPDIS